MQSVPKSMEKQTPPSEVSLQFAIEPEPWLRIFLRNLADLFRPDPPRVWLTAQPSDYWPDALVNRPVAWRQLRQSFLGHLFVALCIFWINLLWLNRPRVLTQEIPQTTITHYQLSPYLPAITPQHEKPTPPARRRPQKADPEYSPQEIVSIHVDHSSTRQTIVQPNPNLLKQDVPLPNIVAWTAIPGAPVAANHPLQKLPMDLPQVVAPVQQVAERNVSRLTFPLSAMPEVVPPAGSVAASHKLPTLPAASAEVVPPSGTIARARLVPALPITGSVVIPPSQEPTPLDARRLQLPPQSPDVAPPASSIASRHSIALMPPASAPQVVPPSQGLAARNLAALQLAASPSVAPPAAPVISGAGRAQALGQLLALNARPVAPVGPVNVPEGNRTGEFAASPEGHPGATASPEIKSGDSLPGADHPGDSSAPANVYVAPPPAKITADAVVSSPSPFHISKPVLTERADASADPIETQVFGGRRRYSIRLSMPNLNSAMGSWIMRFAKMNSEPGAEEDISAPEPLKKVDPGYPASMLHDRIEGVVVLYAVIRSDGTVGQVRVLEGFDSRLDENARIALEQWRFRPGTRNGIPVDVEAVVRVPFRGPKRSF